MNYLSRKYFPEKSTGRCFSHFNRGITVCFAKKALPSFSRLSRSCFYCGEGDRFVLPGRRETLLEKMSAQTIPDRRTALHFGLSDERLPHTNDSYSVLWQQHLKSGSQGLISIFLKHWQTYLIYCRNNISSICRKTAVGRCSVKTGALRRNSCGLMNFPHRLPHYY